MHRSFLKRFPLFFWLLFSSVSNFRPGTGGWRCLLFRFTSSVLSCCREGGALQTDIAVCGEHSPCSGHTGLAPYRGVCAFSIYTAQAPDCSIWSGPCVEYSSSFPVLHKSADSVESAFCTCVLCLPRPELFRQPEAWAQSPWVRRAFSLRSKRLGQPEAWAHSPLMQCAFSLCGPSARRSGACGLVRSQGLASSRDPPGG